MQIDRNEQRRNVIMFSLRNLAQEQTELFIGYCADKGNRFIRDYIHTPTMKRILKKNENYSKSE